MLQITKPRRPNDVRQRRGFAFCVGLYLFIGFIVYLQDKKCINNRRIGQFGC